MENDLSLFNAPYIQIRFNVCCTNHTDLLLSTKCFLLGKNNENNVCVFPKNYTLHVCKLMYYSRDSGCTKQMKIAEKYHK